MRKKIISNKEAHEHPIINSSLQRGEREGGRESRREGGRERRREVGREGEREGGREGGGGREKDVRMHHLTTAQFTENRAALGHTSRSKGNGSPSILSSLSRYSLSTHNRRKMNSFSRNVDLASWSC